MIRGKLCKKCRRANEKLFLKGERCNSTKCAMVKRNYPPGIHGQKGYSRLSSFGLHLKEKQKIRNIYGISEKQMSNYMKLALHKKGNTEIYFLQLLERRLDNVIFRLGLAESRIAARQLVSHGHFLINNRSVDIPSFIVKINDEITLKKKSFSNKYFVERLKKIEKYTPSVWLYFDKKKLSAKILKEPEKENLNLGFQTQLVVEYYSR
ncbi:MAG: 30S ribosomal protein S4 [Patescibacteria group bacterium]